MASTDLIALLLLTLVGVLAFDHGGLLVIAGFTLTVGAVVVCATPGLAHPLIRLVGRFVPKLEPKLHEAYDSMRALVRPGALAWGTFLSVLAWFAEEVSPRHLDLDAVAARIVGDWSDRHGVPGPYASALRARIAGA